MEKDGTDELSKVRTCFGELPYTEIFFRGDIQLVNFRTTDSNDF